MNVSFRKKQRRITTKLKSVANDIGIDRKKWKIRTTQQQGQKFQIEGKIISEYLGPQNLQQPAYINESNLILRSYNICINTICRY